MASCRNVTLTSCNIIDKNSRIDFKVKPVMFNDTRVKLQIWDTAGQERFHTLSTSYFRGAQGFVLVYDITNLDSFQSITSWMKDIHEKAGDEVDVILLGNKCDKESERVVPKQKGEKLAWEHGIPFFETSAKDNVNIEDAFSVLTKEILEKKSCVLYDFDVVALNEKPSVSPYSVAFQFLQSARILLSRDAVLQRSWEPFPVDMVSRREQSSYAKLNSMKRQCKPLAPNCSDKRSEPFYLPRAK
ncbi:PREDICTED: ras-related protein Rab-10-like, partial [Cariama cristata]|uniref:ras-related protein Rab-10-like n=1 Tax=Cariama cristata TaxID=54380 RepID=UPI00051FF493